MVSSEEEVSEPAIVEIDETLNKETIEENAAVKNGTVIDSKVEGEYPADAKVAIKDGSTVDNEAAEG